MANLVTDLVAELETVAIAATGLVQAPAGKRNVFTAVQFLQRSFISELRKSGNIVTPLILIDIGRFRREEDLCPNDPNVKRAPVTIYYVLDLGGPADTNSQDAAYAGAWNIKSAIDKPSAMFNTFYSVEEGDVMSGRELPFNQQYLGESQGGVIAAAAVWDPGLLVELYA